VNVDLRYIVCFVFIMIKDIFKTYNQAGTFLVPLRNFFITMFRSMVILLILLILFYHRYHT